MTETTNLAEDAIWQNIYNLCNQQNGESAFNVFRAYIGSRMNDALEMAAQECERHAKFCKDEAHKGGNFQHLIARYEEAIYNAEQIRKLL